MLKQGEDKSRRDDMKSRHERKMKKNEIKMDTQRKVDRNTNEKERKKT